MPAQGDRNERLYYAKAVYGREEIDAVIDVLENRSLTLMDGPAVAALEARVAALFGKAVGLMVNSGSSANMLAVASLDLPAGAEVITPALTFSTTVAPLLQNRLVPVFVDVEPDTYVIDPERVEAMIGPETKAMMVPNLIGNVADWTALRAIADRHGLKLIEDSADTIGSTIDDAPTGALSDISTTSFYASHIVTGAGFGGMATFHDGDLARRARLLRGWGRSSSLIGESEKSEDRFGIEVDGIPYDAKFVFSGVGYNFMPSEISAAFAMVQLDRLAEYTVRRIRNFEMLWAFFAEYEDLFVLPRQRDDVRTPWLAFPLIVREGAPFIRRDLQMHFESNGIQTRTVFTGNILRQPGFADIPRREDPEGYPNADAVMRGGMLLGCHQGMDGGDVARICEVFKAFVEQ